MRLIPLMLIAGLYAGTQYGCSSSSVVDESAAIQGTWLPSQAELGGKPFPDEVRKTIKLVIDSDNYTVNVGKAVDRGTVRLNPGTEPREMDIVGTEGPNKGKTFLAIYDRKGEDFRICYDLSGKSRPKEFETEEGTQLFLVIYKRVGQ
jgi:uncharacterized protein (TIGR03067 family)